MNKTEFVDRIAEKKELSKKEALEMVETVFGEASDVIGEGFELSLHGFGKFNTRERAEREGVNPQTKQKILIPASKTVGFKPAKALKELVNE